MSEELFLNRGASRADEYASLLPQLKSLSEGEPNVIANLANVSAALRQTFGFFWVGFYLVDNNVSDNDELVLGPFQGDIACTRIRKGAGVCGSAWETQKPIVVADVDQFPGHIACSSASRSEIVIPIIKNGVVLAVLDVDSDQLDDFSVVDAEGLSNICEWLSNIL